MDKLELEIVNIQIKQINMELDSLSRIIMLNREIFKCKLVNLKTYKNQRKLIIDYYNLIDKHSNLETIFFKYFIKVFSKNIIYIR